MTKTIILPARYENLEKICNFVDAAAQKSDFDDMARYSVKTAIDEACSNIIDHAYGGEGLGIIECSYHITRDSITVVLHDYGKPFDPSKIPEPDLSVTIEQRKERGLGLYFMRKLMDEVHFEFSKDRGNFLTMVKHREKLT